MTLQLQHCDLCLRRDISSVADKYCQQCDEKLCNDCTGHHQLFKAFQSHQILSIEEFKQLPHFVRQIQQYCSEHRDSLEFYCRGHDEVCCKRCMTSSHKYCKDVDVIEDLLNTSSSSLALEKFEGTLEDVECNMDVAIEGNESCLRGLDTAKNDILKLVEEKKKEIISHLETLEKNIQEDFNDGTSENRKLLVNRIRELEIKRHEASTMKKDIEALRKHASSVKIFLGTRYLEQAVFKLKTYVQSVGDKGSLFQTNIEFKINTRLQNFIREVKDFGVLSKVNKESKPKFCWNEEKAAQISIQNRRDINEIILKIERKIITKVNGITGCAVMKDGSVLFTMKANLGAGTLLMYNSNGQVVSRLTINNSCAFDIVPIGNNTAVVTGGGWGTILHFVDTNALVIKNTLNSGDHFYGVTYNNGTVISGTESNAIIRIPLSDTKNTHTVPTSNTRETYLASHNNFIYHSDQHTNAVICYDLNGKRKWTYKNEVLNGPRGISVDSFANVYVTGWTSNNVVVISADGKQSKQILGLSDGIKCPCAIFFDKDRQQLLVVNHDGHAFVYGIFWF